MSRVLALTDSAPPSLQLLLREAMQIVDWRRTRVPVSRARALGNAADRPVLILPGFMASDGSTRPLRHALRVAGFRAYGWKLGRNFGLKAEIFDQIDARLDRIAAEHPGPAVLVGWSLGGLLAREYAKARPGRVAKVVTLGSPFSGDIRANNAWRLYEFVAGHKVDAPPVDCTLTEKPPVETIAIWSRRDGIVAPASARGEPEESDRHIEVGCGHIEFTYAPEAVRAVIDALNG